MIAIALAQMCSTSNIEENLRSVQRAVDSAVQKGCSLIAFPENCLYLGSVTKLRNGKQKELNNALEELKKQAEQNQISILVGSTFEVEPPDSTKCYNSSILIGTSGEIVHKYRKIHLFDIDLPDLKHQESDDILPGHEIRSVQHQGITIGLTICYDIRFPAVYQTLSAQGAELIFVPAAFTVPTGEAHWLALLRARAIENQVYIAAPAQYGKHGNSRESFGRTALIDPWGKIVDLAPNTEKLIFGTVDLNHLHDIRRRMPVIRHRVEGVDFT